MAATAVSAQLAAVRNASAYAGVKVAKTTHRSFGLRSVQQRAIKIGSLKSVRASSSSSRRAAVECKAIAAPEAASQTSHEKPRQSDKPDWYWPVGHRVWFSDLITEKTKAYFNRTWTKKDITYASFITALHLGCLAAPFCFTWANLALAFGLYLVTGMLGITLAYHRLLSHKSFQVPKPVEYFLAYCGAMAIQGDPMEWASCHRYHHQYCDTAKDPHTPKEGFWHSHGGWFLDSSRTEALVGRMSNVKDMDKDPFYLHMQKYYMWHVAASAALLFAFGGFPALIWGFCVRTVWVFHITWLVNSASHVWGFQSWNTGDLSKNNWWVGILAFGEGWHNNHHAFEYSARHGLKWWQFDPTWYCIKIMQVLGLASKVKLPSERDMKRYAFN